MEAMKTQVIDELGRELADRTEDSEFELKLWESVARDIYEQTQARANGIKGLLQDVPQFGNHTINTVFEVDWLGTGK